MKMLLAHGSTLAAPEPALPAPQQLQRSAVSEGSRCSQMLPHSTLLSAQGVQGAPRAPPASREANVSLTDWVRGSWSYKAEPPSFPAALQARASLTPTSPARGAEARNAAQAVPSGRTATCGTRHQLGLQELIDIPETEGIDIMQCKVSLKRLSTAPLIPFKQHCCQRHHLLDLKFLKSWEKDIFEKKKGLMAQFSNGFLKLH